MAKASNTSVKKCCMYNVHVQCTCTMYILFCGFYNVQNFAKIDTQKYKILYAGTKF